jgi:hypothetical protein
LCADYYNAIDFMLKDIFVAGTTGEDTYGNLKSSWIELDRNYEWL